MTLKSAVAKLGKMTPQEIIDLLRKEKIRSKPKPNPKSFWRADTCPLAVYLQKVTGDPTVSVNVSTIQNSTYCCDQPLSVTWVWRTSDAKLYPDLEDPSWLKP